MAVQMNFRSALNGFNRDDVVHYIEYLNTKHMAEINQLKSEMEFLRNKPAAESEVKVDEIVEQQAARIRELFDENKKLKEQSQESEKLQKQLADTKKLDDLAEENRKLREQLEDAKKLEGLAEENKKLQEQLAEAQAQKERAVFSRKEEELEAYRRAERAERMAQERAEQLYRQTNGVLADAMSRVDETADHIDQITAQVLTQLNELQAAVSGSKQVLRDAAATINGIRPEQSNK